MPETVLVVGEALVDVVIRNGERIAHPGGSPLNVAYGLGRLGIPTTLVTEFGADSSGALIADHLASADVTVARNPVQRTSEAVATITPDGQASYEFDITWTLAPFTTPAVDLVHVGSISALLEPGAAAVRAITAAPPAGAVVTFDPNIRAALLPDHHEVLAAVAAIGRHAHIVKMSDEDAEWLYPGESPAAVAAHYLGGTTTLFALTRGGEGSYLSTGRAETFLPARPTTVVDTIGAGDSFMAGLIFAVLTGGLADAVTAGTLEPAVLETIGGTAAACAAITVSRAGANPPSLAELTAARG